MLKRASAPPRADAAASTRKGPSLDAFIETGDVSGAVTLLEFQLRELRAGDAAAAGAGAGAASAGAARTLLWLGWAAFHKGDYARALEAYRLLEECDARERDAAGAGLGSRAGIAALQAAALFYCGDFAGAAAAAAEAPESALATRAAFHAAFRLGDEAGLAAAQARLAAGSRENALSLAAMQFLRGQFQESANSYKRLIADGKDEVALNAFLALCLYKLDYCAFLSPPPPLSRGAFPFPTPPPLFFRRPRRAVSRGARRVPPGAPDVPVRHQFEGVQSFQAVQWQGSRGRAQDPH
jgi:tetratricopeptide (TPR) repeat protein